MLETDPLNLALALRLWDISAALRSRQVVLLLAADLDALREALVRFCREHPGFELPMRMIAWPWRSQEENQAYQGLVEQAAAQLQSSQGQVLVEYLEHLRPKAGATPEAVAVLTGVPAIVTGRLAGWLADGARAAGMDAVACCPETPLTAGPLAGLSKAADLACHGKGTRIILMEQCRNHWPLARADLPLISWLINVEPTGEGWQFPVGRDDLAAVTTDRQREQLLEKAWPARRIVHVPAFVTPKALAVPLDGPREGILLVSDLPPDDPDKAGITLYSQKTLWEAIRDRLEQPGRHLVPRTGTALGPCGPGRDGDRPRGPDRPGGVRKRPFRGPGPGCDPAKDRTGHPGGATCRCGSPAVAGTPSIGPKASGTGWPTTRSGD